MPKQAGPRSSSKGVVEADQTGSGITQIVKLRARPAPSQLNCDTRCHQLLNTVLQARQLQRFRYAAGRAMASAASSSAGDRSNAHLETKSKFSMRAEGGGRPGYDGNRRPAILRLNLPHVRCWADRRRLLDQRQRCAHAAGGSILCHRSQGLLRVPAQIGHRRTR
jgi:hypothetical protein